ncbi:MAG TPA: LemA family protein [Candidatus Limnocylindrales bacterium]|nr:LemA family protein [Candidatus Limnocylindrales bacterium]
MLRRPYTFYKKTLLMLLLILSTSGCGYNTLVELDQRVNSAWAQVENQLQRRSDLIPNLVNIVKGYAGHEKEIFQNIANARAAMMNAKSIPEKIDASNQMETSLRQLFAVVENYPQLKADATFARLMDEVAGTENRIAVERMRYNQAVEAYNSYARKIPVIYTVKIFGFDKEKPYFKAVEGAQTAPQINFNR